MSLYTSEPIAICNATGNAADNATTAIRSACSGLAAARRHRAAAIGSAIASAASMNSGSLTAK
jgi:hypothetical protein